MGLLGCRLLAPDSPVTVATPRVALPANPVYKQDVEKLQRRYGEIVVMVRIMIIAQTHDVGSPHTPLYPQLLQNGVHPRVSPLSGKLQMGQYIVSLFSMFAFSRSSTRHPPHHQLVVIRLKIYSKHYRHLTC